MSDSHSFEELSALWTQVFGQPPPIKASTAELARLLVQYLPRLPPYAPLAAPLRPLRASCATSPPSDSRTTSDASAPSTAKG